jgi:hypothetical protein
MILPTNSAILLIVVFRDEPFRNGVGFSDMFLRNNGSPESRSNLVTKRGREWENSLFRHFEKYITL